MQEAPSQEALVSHLQEEVFALSEQVACLLDENEQLKQQNREKYQEISRLKLELQTDDEKSGTWFSWWRGTSPPVKDFIINFRVTGKTGGCEQKFLEDVSKRLSLQGISLRVEKFTETSRHLLLVFCPIASNMANDTGNVLAGLHGKQKVLLVVMHYVRKDNTETSVDPKQKVTHPALVQTVHTRYTLQDGFYPCKMNAVAVADVAAAIKDLAGDN